MIDPRTPLTAAFVEATPVGQRSLILAMLAFYIDNLDDEKLLPFYRDILAGIPDEWVTGLTKEIIAFLDEMTSIASRDRSH